MRKFGICVNSGKQEALAVLERVKKTFEAGGCGVEVFDLMKDTQSDDAAASGLEAVISLGGDGTLLGAARFFSRYDIPILGINLGRVGFLTTEEEENAEQVVRQLIEKNYTVARRLMLSANVNGTDGYYAVNELGIFAKEACKLIEVKVWVDGELAMKYRGDGLLLATPTGSTAYSLSAGGPVIDPKIHCILITPVCSHSLTRPIVAEPNAHIRVDAEAPGEIAVVFDGQRELLELSGTVCVEKSRHEFKLISQQPQSYYGLLHSKIFSNIS